MTSSQPSWFSTLEKTAALVLLATLSPTLLLVGLLIQATAGRPIVLTTPATTRNGAQVALFRFRTSGPGTPIFRLLGRMLRQYGLDEIPALWNVIRGDLSLKQALRPLMRQ